MDRDASHLRQGLGLVAVAAAMIMITACESSTPALPTPAPRPAAPAPPAAGPGGATTGGTTGGTTTGGGTDGNSNPRPGYPSDNGKG